jgi:hypothetical protein
MEGENLSSALHLFEYDDEQKTSRRIWENLEEYTERRKGWVAFVATTGGLPKTINMDRIGKIHNLQEFSYTVVKPRSVHSYLTHVGPQKKIDFDRMFKRRKP